MAYDIFSSDRTALTETIVLMVNPAYSHCFAGIRYYNSAGEQITPTAGTVVINARHVTNNYFDSVTNGTLNATAPGSEAEWGGNVSEARAVPAGLAGTDLATYQLVVVQNDT